MPLIQIQSVDAVKQIPSLPEAAVRAEGTLAAETILGFDPTAGVVRVLVEYPLPDDNQVSKRMGKKTDKNPEGDQIVTSYTYGVARGVILPMADSEGNQMKFTSKLFAPVLDAVAAESEGDD